MRLGEILLLNGWLADDQLERCLDFQKQDGGRIGSSLLEMGYITETQLLEALGEQSGVPVATGEDLHHADQDSIELFDRAKAKKYEALPLRHSDKQVEIALLQPNNLSLIDDLSFITGRTIIPYVTHEARLYEALETFYGEPAPVRFSFLVQRLDDPNLESPLGEPQAPQGTPVPPPRAAAMAEEAQEEPSLETDFDAALAAISPALVEPAPRAAFGPSLRVSSASTRPPQAAPATSLEPLQSRAVRGDAAGSSSDDAARVDKPDTPSAKEGEVVFPPPPPTMNSLQLTGPISEALSSGGPPTSLASLTTIPRTSSMALETQTLETTVKDDPAAPMAAAPMADEPTDSPAASQVFPGASQDTATVADGNASFDDEIDSSLDALQTPTGPDVGLLDDRELDSKPAESAPSVGSTSVDFLFEPLLADDPAVSERVPAPEGDSPDPAVRPDDDTTREVPLDDKVQGLSEASTEAFDAANLLAETSPGEAGEAATGERPPRATTSLATIVELLATAGSHSAVGRYLLTYLLEYWQRVVLFQVRRGEAVGWMGDGPNIDAEDMKSVVIDLGQPSVFLDLTSSGGHFAGRLPELEAHRELLTHWQQELAQDCLVFPVQLSGKTACIAYCDGALGRPSFKIAALGELTHAAAAGFSNCIAVKRHTP